MDIKTAEEKYNKAIENNLKYIENGGVEGKYMDPDYDFEKNISIKILFEDQRNEFTIRMASDGLCGFKKIDEFETTNEGKKNAYMLIRKNMFNCLSWPVQSMSINQKRGFKSVFDDRIDKTLQEIENFYQCVNVERILSLKLLSQIRNECKKMNDVFLNFPTFLWLCSFKDFNSFIEGNKLEYFVGKKSNGMYESVLYDDKQGIFTEKYYNELKRRTEEYKRNNIDRSFPNLPEHSAIIGSARCYNQISI